MTDHLLTRRTALVLFSVVVVTWGLNWTVTKFLVLSVSPLWSSAIRSALATVTLLVVLLARRQLIVPARGDWPVVLSVATLHMGAFSALIAFGLQLVPVGRSIVLGYTTPLWVAPAAWLLLREPITPARLGGIALGLAGLMVMFNPLAFDWASRDALVGNGLLLLAALCWAANIVYLRRHRWIATPFQLVFWQALLASLILTTLAFLCEGPPPAIVWTRELVAAFLFAGICGTALAHWAMALINRSLPATTTSLGLLATPVMGVILSALLLGETVSLALVVAMALILGGIAVGTFTGGTPAQLSRAVRRPVVRSP
ncbi:DMT family transporter [Tardiphaga alba]|uniref:DMT family transporter n=1 Tax=Tardiphaga alba TaxID=340268 RepID=A0ABX8A6D2_9BRAD|nr:DMT family transporter [Tardiphaga alba]QUS39254.1 DMT family transporter [Tardiphaga alba]